MASLSPQAKGVLDLIAFRQQMGEPLLSDIATKYWGKEILKEFSLLNGDKIKTAQRKNPKEIQAKQKYVRETIWFNRIFEILGIVKYVGISGSLAADKFKEGEDLDLFIVTANGTSWIYRGILKLLLGKKARLYEDTDVADTLCVNFIAEERGISFDPDIFVLHELLHIIDVYNPAYKDFIISQNQWLSDIYGIREKANSTPNKLTKFCLHILYSPIRLLDFFAYHLQVIYMKFKKHNPKLKRIKNGRKTGRIEFYPEDFRVKVMSEFWIQREKLEKEYLKK